MENKAGEAVSQANGNPPSVVVCTPCGSQMASLFAHDLCRLFGITIRTRPEIKLVHMLMEGSLIPKQRELLTREALQTGYTHLLWLDTDMRFPAETLLRLLDHHKRIVAANYVERRPPYRPIAFPSLRTAWNRLYTEPESTGLVEVEAIGTGIMLVEMDVFKKLPEPWFCVGWVEQTKEFMGEDVFFCDKAKHYGETIWMDHDLSREVGHIGQHTFTMREALQARPMALEGSQ